MRGCRDLFFEKSIAKEAGNKRPMNPVCVTVLIVFCINIHTEYGPCYLRSVTRQQILALLSIWKPFGPWGFNPEIIQMQLRLQLHFTTLKVRNVSEPKFSENANMSFP